MKICWSMPITSNQLHSDMRGVRVGVESGKRGDGKGVCYWYFVIGICRIGVSERGKEREGERGRERETDSTQTSLFVDFCVLRRTS
jgi:hypothetical protein